MTIGTHYCMGMPVATEWMIGHEDLSCGMTSMESHSDDAGIKMDCCDDEYVSLEGIDIAKKEVGQSLPTLQFIAVFAYSVKALEPDIAEPDLQNYSLPPPETELNKKFQTFLI